MASSSTSGESLTWSLEYGHAQPAVAQLRAVDGHDAPLEPEQPGADADPLRGAVGLVVVHVLDGADALAVLVDHVGALRLDQRLARQRLHVPAPCARYRRERSPRRAPANAPRTLPGVSDRPPLVLASRSPQRRALLTQLGLPFRVAVPAYDEVPLDLPPARVVEERSRGKARSVAGEPGDGPVVGVDTEVVLDDEVLGQPPDAEAAAALLRRLAGRTHHVLSGLTVRRGAAERTGHAVTAVAFRPLTADEVAAYVVLGEWRGRAGAGASRRRAPLVARVDGCYPNVVGLPVALLVESLHGGVPSAPRIRRRPAAAPRILGSTEIGLSDGSVVWAAATWGSTSAPRTRSCASRPTASS